MVSLVSCSAFVMVVTGARFHQGQNQAERGPPSMLAGPWKNILLGRSIVWDGE